MRQVLSILAMCCLVISAVACSTTSDGKTKEGTQIEGVVATGAPYSATVYVKDANGNVESGVTDEQGRYSIPSEGLTPPFFLMAEGEGGGMMFSLATEPGVVNITPVTTIIFGLIIKGDPASSLSIADMKIDAPLPELLDIPADELHTLISDANSSMAEIFASILPSSGWNFITAAFEANGSGFDSILDLLVMSLAPSGDATCTFNGATLFTLDVTEDDSDLQSAVDAAEAAVNANREEINSSISHENSDAGDESANLGFLELAPLAERIYYTDVDAKTKRDFDIVRSGTDVCDRDDYNRAKNYFTNALLNDSDNIRGNLGLALFELGDLNYNETLWSIYTQFMDYDHDDVTVTMTAAQITSLLSDDVLGALDRAIDRLTTVIGQAPQDFTVRLVDTAGENHDVTKAEVYVLRAGMKILRSVVKIALAYEIQPVNASGSWAWLDELIEDDDSDSETCEVTTVAGKNIVTLTSFEDEVDRDNGVLFWSIMKSNYDRASFGGLRAGQDLAGAKTDLAAALDDLLQVYTTVMARSATDESLNLLKSASLEDLDEEVVSRDLDRYMPDQEWATSVDAVNWARNALNNTVMVEVRGQDFQVNASRFFAGYLANLKSYLPRFSWKPEDQWVDEEIHRWGQYFGDLFTGLHESVEITFEDQLDWLDNEFPDAGYGYDYSSDDYWKDERWTDPENSWRWVDDPEVNDRDNSSQWHFDYYYVNGQQLGMVLDNGFQMSKLVEIETGYHVDPVDALDAAGDPNDNDYLVFDDYTFNDVFPGMTQAEFDRVFQ